jgi:hypothetical protein
MKTSRLALPGSLLALSLVLSAGCSKERPATTTAAQPQPAPSPAATDQPSITAATPAAVDPFAEMKAALERATLEQHDGLAGIQQRMDQDLDAQTAAKKAGADVSLAATEKLDSASADFAEKLRALSVARPETWNSAKHDAELALQNVRSAFAAVMNSPARR